MWKSLKLALQRGSLAGREAAPLPAGITSAPRTPEAGVEIMGEALRVEVRRLFHGSLKLRHLDAGSCNACEAELQALLNPFYDLQRFGIDLVASPRHADGLLLTGPVTRHLEEAVRLTDAATPRPRLIVAVGDCACDGGFCADSFAVNRGAPARLPVDVKIPGCPPRPAEIVHALLAALGRERIRAAVVSLALAVCAFVPPPARAQLGLLAPTFRSLNGGAVWGSAGLPTSGTAASGMPMWRGGVAVFYGPFGGAADTTITFLEESVDSIVSALPDLATPGGTVLHRERSSRLQRIDSRRLGGGKVLIAVGYQHSPFYRFGTRPLPAMVAVGGPYFGVLLGPYPVRAAWRKIGWYAGLGGTIVRLADQAARVDTLALSMNSERTLAPEAMLLVMHSVAPGYRLIGGVTYQYLRFGSLAYRAGEPGRTVPGAVLAGLPESVRLSSVHWTLGLSFYAASLIPAH